MRKFRLFNADGEIYNMSDVPRAWIHDIKGLGFEAETEYAQIGTQFIETNRILGQAKPSGILSLYGYEEYERFMLFIQKRPLTLEYTAAHTYLMDVNIKSIEKKELEMRRMECPIEFECLGRIYKKVTLRVEEDQENGKIYGVSQYPYKYADNTQGCIEIECDSQLDSPVTITMIGPCINPTWTHSVNGVKCCTGRVKCEIPEGHRLIISTHGQYRIIETDAYGKELEDRYQDSDFSTDRFVYLKNGINKMSFVHDGSDAMNVIVEGFISYESI